MTSVARALPHTTSACLPKTLANNIHQRPQLPATATWPLHQARLQMFQHLDTSRSQRQHEQHNLLCRDSLCLEVSGCVDSSSKMLHANTKHWSCQRATRQRPPPTLAPLHGLHPTRDPKTERLAWHRARLGILKLSTNDRERARSGCTSLSPMLTNFNAPLLPKHKVFDSHGDCRARSGRGPCPAMKTSNAQAYKRHTPRHRIKCTLQVPCSPAHKFQSLNHVLPLWSL